MGWSRFLAFFVVALLPAVTTARKTPQTPCTGSFVVSGTPLAGDGSVSPDILVIGSTISTASGCPPVPVKLKATKKGTVVKAARWSSCAGLTGKAKLSGKIAAGCGSFSGVFRAKKSKVRRTVTAGRSTCGDGALDTSTESCDGTAGCAAGTTCRIDCTCSDPSACTTATPPQAAFTQGGTLQAGAAATFDASASTGDALVYSWDFGDDRRGGGAQIAHVYAAAGQRTVRLTVKDGCGATASSEQVLAVAAGPAPTATTSATGKVRDVGGQPIDGALVTAVPGGSATTNGDGDVTVTVGQGVPVRITVGKTGYAEQVILTSVPDVPDPDAYFEATLVAREASQTLADAAAGGAVAGKHGARVEMPAGALVDAGGNPVAGAVDVALTPVDVTRDVEGFPGRATGLEPDGSEGPIVTYGVTEYAFEQNGQALNLAPGAQATIEIPIYARNDLDGRTLAVGDPYPLWSLDPATGGWVQEGFGTVVASATSPSGLALRGAVTHFSWWNCDSGVDPYNPKPKCLVDTNADGILEDLTGTGHCWHAGTGPEQPDDGFSAMADPPVRLPNWIGQTVLPAQGGVILQIPSEMDVVLHSRALGGLLRGTKLIRGAAFVEEDVIVKLEPVDENSTHITLPFAADRELSHDDDLHLYDFDGVAGQTVFVTVDEDGSSVTAADVSMILPDDTQLGPVNYRPTVNNPGEIGLVLPETGNYRITVEKLPAAVPGGYHITVGYTGDFPIVLSTSPARNATGVAASVTPSATFSMDIDPSGPVMSLIQGEDHVTTTKVTAGAVSTMTPTAPLVPGAGYTAVFDGFRTPGSTSPNGFPRKHEVVFNVAEVPATLVKLGIDRSGTSSVAADASGNAWTTWQGAAFSSQNHETRGVTYTPGAGWSPPTLFNGGAFVGPFYGTAMAAIPGGAVTVFPSPGGGTGQVSMYESRWTTAGGWGARTLIEEVDGLFRQRPLLGADAAGNLLAVFGTTGPPNDVYWNRYTAGGSWTAPALLFEDAETQHLAVNAAGEGIVVVRKYDGNQALVRRFTPGGGWSAEEPFEDDVEYEGLRVGIDGDGNAFLLVVKLNQHILRRFDVDTQTWSAPVNVQGSPACPSSVRIAVAADGHAIVSGCTNAAPGPGIFATRYVPDAGDGTWEGAVLLGSGNTGIHDLGMDANGNAVAMWTLAADNTMGKSRRFSTASGWSATTSDFPAPTGLYSATMAVGGNGVAVVVFDGYTVQRAFGVRLP